jgi:para-nitrobenzyl esterase
MTNNDKVQPDRRHFLQGSVALGGALVVGRQTAMAAEGLVADTAYGKIRGYADGPIKVFKGVPYGAPTDGPNRWLPPKQPKAWSEVRETTQQGPMCPQRIGAPMKLAWTNFGKSGNPSNTLIPDWKPYNAKERPIMVIDDQPKLVNDPLHDSRVIIGELRGKYHTIR